MLIVLHLNRGTDVGSANTEDSDVPSPSGFYSVYCRKAEAQCNRARKDIQSIKLCTKTA